MKFTLLNTLAEVSEQHVLFAQTLAEKMGKEFVVACALPEDLEEYASENGVDMLFISCRNHGRTIQQYLNACRGLRLPYVFLTDTMRLGGKSEESGVGSAGLDAEEGAVISRILMPVSMLEEEVYKAEIGVHVARFTGAETLLLQAKDYGSKAAQNVQKMSVLYDKFGLKYSVGLAKKDSFGIVKETADRQKDFMADLCVLTASRDYGLDDILFGPVERYAIMHSSIPVMLLNPREDLFALCD